jgi:hypothetical protein
MFDKSLIVMRVLDATKAFDELEFKHIPIWVRVSGLPFGMMNRAAGVVIGNEIGETIQVEVDEEGMAIGKVLRIQVRLDITLPLRRGVMVEIDDAGTEKWCPVAYEYLPDFCFVCGLIGHLETACNVILPPTEQKQYGCWLKFIPQRKRSDEGSWNKGYERKNSGPWRGSNSGDWSGRKTGSDADDWRKNKPKESKKGEEKEVTSPLKLSAPVSKGGSQKQLVFSAEDGLHPSRDNAATPDGALGAPPSEVEMSVQGLPLLPEAKQVKVNPLKGDIAGVQKPLSTFKRKGRDGRGNGAKGGPTLTGEKRGATPMDVDAKKAKKLKNVVAIQEDQTKIVGLANQSQESQ